MRAVINRRARAVLKWVAYRIGALSAIHRMRNVRRLTVVMFHRVLPEMSSQWSTADPTYTVSERLFSECLDFFRRHYAVISLETLLAACEGRQRLPGRSLLITFDDGWADNETAALPLLQRAGLPAAVFVVTEPIDEASAPWWQEIVFAAARRGKLSKGGGAALWRMAGGAISTMPDFATPDGILALTSQIAKLSPGIRQSLLAEYVEGVGDRHMLTRTQLYRLLDNGIEIGSHGTTHVPLTMVEAPEYELRESQQWLRALCGRSTAASAISFPHGRYTPEIVALARVAGFRAQFTSDPWLNPTTRGRPDVDLFGRISIQASEIADESGRLRPELLALWLFLRPLASFPGTRGKGPQPPRKS